MLDQLNCSYKDFVKQFPWLEEFSDSHEPLKVFTIEEKSEVAKDVIDLIKLVEESLSLRPYMNDSQRVVIALKLLPFIQAEQQEKLRNSRIKPGENRNPHGRKGKNNSIFNLINSPELLKEKRRLKEANSTLGKIAKIAKVTQHFVKNAIKATNGQSTETLEQIVKGNLTIKDLIKTQKLKSQ